MASWSKTVLCDKTCNNGNDLMMMKLTRSVSNKINFIIKKHDFKVNFISMDGPKLKFSCFKLWVEKKHRGHSGLKIGPSY